MIGRGSHHPVLRNVLHRCILEGRDCEVSNNPYLMLFLFVVSFLASPRLNDDVVGPPTRKTIAGQHGEASLLHLFLGRRIEMPFSHSPQVCVLLNGGVFFPAIAEVEVSGDDVDAGLVILFLYLLELGNSQFLVVQALEMDGVHNQSGEGVVFVEEGDEGREVASVHGGEAEGMLVESAGVLGEDHRVVPVHFGHPYEVFGLPLGGGLVEKRQKLRVYFLEADDICARLLYDFEEALVPHLYIVLFEPDIVGEESEVPGQLEGEERERICRKQSF